MAKRKASKKATIAIVISFITLVVVIMGILTDWFTNFKKYLPTRSGEPITANADTLYAPDTGLLISQSTSDGIALYSMATPLSDFETYALDANVEAVRTITAHFTPADTTLQKVDYTAAWKNAKSSWANGKDVSDYITLTQSSDGSLDCAVSLLDAIGEQIIITCTARPLLEDDWVPTATCTVDYYKRAVITGFNVSGTLNGEETYNFDVGNNTILTYKNWDTTYDLGDEDSGYNYINVKYTNSVGTIQDQFSVTNLTISITDSVAQSLKTAANVTSLKSTSLFNGGYYMGFLIKDFVDTALGGSSNVSARRSAIYNAFKTAYDAGTPALKIELTSKAKLSGETYNTVFNVKLNPLALGVKATDIGLDTPGIIF